jgi:DNA-binding CsgD family transcriptional regulator
MSFDEGSDVGAERRHTAIDAAAYFALGDEGKEALDPTDPSSKNDGSAVSGQQGGSQMGRRMAELVLSEAERTELKLLSSQRKTAQALATRARIVLECALGLENQEVAARLRVAKEMVSKWRRRFVEQRMDELHDEPRSGAPRSIVDDRVEAVIGKTLESVPENATHWSSRGMAKASGLPVSRHRRSGGRSPRRSWSRPASDRQG